MLSKKDTSPPNAEALVRTARAKDAPALAELIRLTGAELGWELSESLEAEPEKRPSD
ncbi:MAG: hypothetical protein JKY65_28605 [Planctomycetes bacterium]|nr:hypothetical protein [Planctomycetota bacterium]